MKSFIFFISLSLLFGCATKSPKLEVTTATPGGLVEASKNSNLSIAPNAKPGEVRTRTSPEPYCSGRTESGQKEGLWQCYYSNSVKRSEMNFLNGKKHGLFRHWRPDGVLEFEANWENGKFEGVSTHYFQVGSKNLESSFRAGQLHGPSREFYESGHVFREFNFDNGVMNGTFREFSEAGELTFESEFVDGFETIKYSKDMHGER